MAASMKRKRERMVEGGKEMVINHVAHSRKRKALFELTPLLWSSKVTLDFCSWHFNSTVLIPEKTSKEMYDALNDTGHATWLLFHCIGYNLIPTDWCPLYGNSFTIDEDHHDNWSSTIGAYMHIYIYIYSGV